MTVTTALVLAADPGGERHRRLLDPFNRGDDVEAGAGERAAVAAALEDAGAKRGLKRIEPAQDRGAIDAKRLRGGLHRAAAVDREHIAELIPFEHRGGLYRGGGRRAPAPRVHGKARDRRGPVN